ncbi:MAG: hypothetical protein JXO49_11640 [Deltaproteobacteria bacterium]|nr:hypothetical protein [Candidatus Anaeroferrophillus wilburensis]MBN2889986.1 hypothetical protein [Deltaproteobacteria bacterium]
MIAQLIGYLRDHATVMKWLFFAFLAFAVVFDFLAARHHPHFWGDSVIGFWSLFGIGGCLGMIVICKGLSHVWLMKGEDYYDE